MKRAFKWIARILGGLVLLLLILGFAMYMIGGSKIGETYELPDVALSVSNDSVQVARGAHLAASIGCNDCHGDDLSGQEMFDAPPFRVVAPNLTPGGVGGRRTDADLERAIRHGVGSDGTSLIIMPSKAYHGLADEDVGALISYIRSVPVVENGLGETKIKLMGRMLSAGPFDSAFEVTTEASPTSRPPVGSTPEYGEYLLGAFCAYCHGERAQGMEVIPIPDAPPGPGLAAAGLWELDLFKETLRTGITPVGRELDRDLMPARVLGNMTDEDMEALHAFFGTL